MTAIHSNIKIKTGIIYYMPLFFVKCMEDFDLKSEISDKKKITESFFSGVLVLSVSTVIVKVIGLIYKIPMLSYLGAEGMGYFNSAYEIYALLCVISTAGLPTALSMLVSTYKESGKIYKIKEVYQNALLLFLVI